MRYFVIGPQGERYGPADVQLLRQWATEGRLLPHMTLMDESGRPIPATSVPGVFEAPQPSSTFGAMPDPLGSPTLSQPYPGPANPFPGTTPGPSPMPTSAYYRPAAASNADDGSRDVTNSFIFSALGLVCCPVVSNAVAIGFAVRAGRKRHPTAQTALIVACVSLGLVVLVGVFMSVVDQVF